MSSINSDNPVEASLAALSAKVSIKRTQVLYNVTPESTFLPSVDKTILQASVNRRKRRLQASARQQQQRKSAGNNSNTLALITDGSSGGAAAAVDGTIGGSVDNDSNALILAGGADKKDSNQGGGILVVRSVALMLLLGCDVSNSMSYTCHSPKHISSAFFSSFLEFIENKSK